MRRVFVSIMLYRFWRQSSKLAGRFCRGISAKVKKTVRCFLWRKTLCVTLLGVFSGIKKYVVGLIIKTSSDPANMEVK